MKELMTAATVAVLVLGACGSRSGGDDVREDAVPATTTPPTTESDPFLDPDVVDDVTITDCYQYITGHIEVTLEFANDSPLTSDYFVTVRFESASGLPVGEVTAEVWGVERHEEAEETVRSDEDVPDAGATCVIAAVQRTETILEGRAS